MPTPETLISLTNQGELGQLLIRTFGGTSGHTYKNKDSEFLIVFDKESDVPETAILARTICQHYANLGFVLKRVKTGKRGAFEVIVATTEDESVLGIIITTHYPFDGHHKALRATTNLLY